MCSISLLKRKGNNGLRILANFDEMKANYVGRYHAKTHKIDLE